MSAEDLAYVTSFEEIFWGVVLVAITMTLHGYGMLIALLAGNAMKRRVEHRDGFMFGASIVVVASWVILLAHLLEAAVWAGFFVWKDALPTVSIAYYFSLMEYTTVGSAFNLPLRWRLLEGMIAIAGLLCFAWSTGVLFMLAQDFQERQMGVLQRLRDRRAVASRSPEAPSR